MLAATLARESSLGWLRSRTLDDLELLAGFLDIPLDAAVARLHSLAAEAARQLSALPIPLPAYRLISGLREMQTQHGLKRVMFALMNKEGSALHGRLVLEPTSEHSLKGFSVDLTTRSLFSLLMKKTQALVVKADNLEKYQSMIPTPLRSIINPDSFMAMSIFLRDRPIGLYYADNGPDGAVDLQQYEHFKASCQRVIQSLS